MSVSMNIHPRGFSAKWITNFATVDVALDDVGHSYAAIIMHHESQCDELIAAANEAKRLLVEARQLYVVWEHFEPGDANPRHTVVTDPKPRADAEQWASDNCEFFAGWLEVLPATQADLDDPDGEV